MVSQKPKKITSQNRPGRLVRLGRLHLLTLLIKYVTHVKILVESTSRPCTLIIHKCVTCQYLEESLIRSVAQIYFENRFFLDIFQPCFSFWGISGIDSNKIMMQKRQNNNYCSNIVIDASIMMLKYSYCYHKR